MGRVISIRDKYDEIIYCSRCRKEIIDKEDLHINIRGMVHCTKCHKLQEFKDYSNIDKLVLGQRISFTSVQDSREAN